MKNIKYSFLLVIVFFIGFMNISKADTISLTYRDAGCPNTYLPGGANVDCTSPGSFFVSGCPPGNYSGYACNGSTYTGGQNIVLSLSHIVTFSTNKNTYNTGETITPIFSADSDITVNCTIGSAVYTKTIPRSTFTITNLIAKAGSLAPAVFSSPNWVSSFSINTPGNYTFGSDITRNPLTYVNDCNNAGNINIQKLASNSYGISPLTKTFTVSGAVISNCANTPTTTTQTLTGNWRRVLVGNYVKDVSSYNGFDYTYDPAGEKYINYLDISPDVYNGNSFFLWNRYAMNTPLPSLIDVSTADKGNTTIKDLIGQSDACSLYVYTGEGASCQYYDDFAYGPSYTGPIVWYFADGIHSQQSMLLDLSNSESTESPPGYIGGVIPTSIGSVTYGTKSTTSYINTCVPVLRLK